MEEKRNEASRRSPLTLSQYNTPYGRWLSIVAQRRRTNQKKEIYTGLALYVYANCSGREHVRATPCLEELPMNGKRRNATGITYTVLVLMLIYNGRTTCMHGSRNVSAYVMAHWRGQCRQLHSTFGSYNSTSPEGGLRQETNGARRGERAGGR